MYFFFQDEEEGIKKCFKWCHNAHETDVENLCSYRRLESDTERLNMDVSYTVTVLTRVDRFH